MIARNSTPDEFAAYARELYARDIRPKVEPQENGNFIVINLETGEYEIDADDLTVSNRARARFGAAPQFVLRIGRPGAYRLGGAFRAQP